jgi:peptidoglycan biosynthesis protein MviN/MurJ (putative lipid II flippase)
MLREKAKTLHKEICVCLSITKLQKCIYIQGQGHRNFCHQLYKQTSEVEKLKICTIIYINIYLKILNFTGAAILLGVVTYKLFLTWHGQFIWHHLIKHVLPCLYIYSKPRIMEKLWKSKEHFWYVKTILLCYNIDQIPAKAVLNNLCAHMYACNYSHLSNSSAHTD